jgi:hypothetical protein
LPRRRPQANERYKATGINCIYGRKGDIAVVPVGLLNGISTGAGGAAAKELLNPNRFVSHKVSPCPKDVISAISA